MKRSWLVVLMLALVPGLVVAPLALAMEDSKPAWNAPSTVSTQPFTVAQMTPAERRKARRERWQQMTPEQKEALRQDVTEWQEAFAGLGSEEQQALEQAFTRSVEKLRALSPEQQQELLSSIEQLTSALRAKVESMTPEEKERLGEALENLGQAYKDLTAVQKTQFLYRIVGGIDMMRNLTPEQKDRLENALKGLGKAQE